MLGVCLCVCVCVIFCYPIVCSGLNSTSNKCFISYHKKGGKPFIRYVKEFSNINLINERSMAYNWLSNDDILSMSLKEVHM